MYRGLITISNFTPDTIVAMVDELRRNGLRFSNYWLDMPSIGGKGLVVQFDEMHISIDPWGTLKGILRKSGVLRAKITLEEVEVVGQQEVDFGPKG